MAETPRLDLPYLAASQAQKEVYHNISLDRLDLLVQCAVLDRNLSTPPASPVEGDAYIVGPAATGPWATHETHLALYVNLQWAFIAPLPGFQCWVRDEAVQVYWSGSAWTLTGSGGGGSTTLLGLSDTPDSYGGQAGKTLLVNPGETGMVFGTMPGSAPVDATYIVTNSHPTLSAERVVTDNTHIAWDVGTSGQLKGMLVSHGITLDKLVQQAPETLLGVGGDAMGPGADVQPILLGTGLEMLGSTLHATGGGGTSSFLALSDTPDDYTGQAGKAVLVNAGATALEFGTPAAGATTFLALTDSPDSYAGQAGKGVVVNGTATGLDFTTAATGSYDLGLTWSGTLPASQVLMRYPFPRAVDFPAGLTGSQGRAAVAATALTTLDLRKNGTSVGSVQFAAAGTTATFTMASATSFAVGDVLTVHAPASADATLADLGLSLAGTRAVSAGEMGATTFLALTDSPDTYTGHGAKIVQVNAAATALEFVAQDPELAALSVLVSAADRLPYFTGAGTAALATFTAAGRALAGGADAAAQRTTLGLGTLAVQDAGAVAITGGQATLSGGLTLTYGSTALFNGAGTNVPSLDIRHNKATDESGILLKAIGSDVGPAASIWFLNVAASAVGSITTTATTTAYNTSSDARLKHAIVPLTGELDVLRALRPVTFRWNADDSQGHGFLAHELQQTIPDAVSGEPDAVNDDGTIQPQQVDHSKLVPWLVSGMQALLAQVETLTARVAALEG